MSNAQHSAKTGTWYTPVEHLELVRTVLDGIDLDPCSDEYGNERVKATRYITAEENGLTALWAPERPVSVYMNPPGGRPSLVRPFWDKLMQERAEKKIAHAIVATFSLEQLQQVQQMLWFQVCFCKQRTRWHKRGLTKTSPTHANAYVYVPGIIDNGVMFDEVFSRLGEVK